MIQVEGNQVKVILNKYFYDVGAVKQSLKDFKEICEGSVSNKKEIEVTLKSKDSSLTKELGKEFCNYVLGLMKNKTLV